MKVRYFCKMKAFNTRQPQAFLLALVVSFFCLTAGCDQPEAAPPLQPTIIASDPITQEDVEPTAPESIELPVPLSEKSAETFLKTYGEQNHFSVIAVETEYGEITMRLYPDVELHRANFLYLIEREYFNPTQIVRIMPDFVIQGGNSDEREDQAKRAIIGDYTLPAERKPQYIHKRGALAMSRSYTDNPEKRSSAYDFYVVIGSPVSAATLHTASLENGMVYTDQQKKIYQTIGGTPHLDGEHTVFGEVISGMKVVETISQLDRDGSDWPRKHVSIRITAIR